MRPVLYFVSSSGKRLRYSLLPTPAVEEESSRAIKTYIYIPNDFYTHSRVVNCVKTELMTLRRRMGKDGWTSRPSLPLRPMGRVGCRE